MGRLVFVWVMRVGLGGDSGWFVGAMVEVFRIFLLAVIKFLKRTSYCARFEFSILRIVMFIVSVCLQTRFEWRGALFLPGLLWVLSLSTMFGDERSDLTEVEGVYCIGTTSEMTEG